MDRSLLAAVSGIEANQTYLDVVGNNIANLNTNGYKSQSAQFADLLSQQLAGGGAPGAGYAGVNPMSVGSGVRLGSITAQMGEGSLQQTGQPTDVAIQGAGFLSVTQGGQSYYTRDGHLVLDANGDLATATGALVQGWTAANGVLNTNGPVGPLRIPTGQMLPAAATTEITMGGNLPAWSGSGTATPITTTITAYDGVGTPLPVTLTFTPVAGSAGTWSMQGTAPSSTGGTQNLWSSPPQVTFNTTTGQLTAVTGGTTGPGGAIDVPVTTMPSGGSFPAGDVWNIVFPAPGSATAVTQFAGPASAQAQSQDGGQAGTLTSFSIGSNGVITGSFTNGRTQSLGQLALASFANPTGLADTGNLLFQATPNSGVALVGVAGSGGRGTLVGGSLEASNVNLAGQLTDLITAQEAYQANTKVISTVGQSLQSLLNVP